MAGLELLKGTLDLLILRAVADGSLHGYGIARWIERGSEGEFLVEEGSLYPALQRLRGRGWLRAEWGVSENGRRARFYELTSRGEAQLESELRSWRRYTRAMARAIEGEAVP